METYTKEQIEIEKNEYELLKKLNLIFTESLTLFNINLKNSLNYINYITLPIIMASLEDKSFNPFAEIIEKHISFIINSKMSSYNYKIIPLGYSSDLTFETESSIINIDIKTANINNPADFKEEIALGLNQTSYGGKLPSGIKGKTEYSSEGIKEVKTFPNLPEEYQLDNKKKLVFTNGLLFIYPDYKKIIDDIRKKYIEIRGILNKNLLGLFRDVFSNEKNTKEFLDYKPPKERFKRRDLIIDNLMRAYFIHNKKEIKLGKEDKDKLDKFSEKIKEVAKKLEGREIKPVAIISISIPNGKLSPHYDEQIVSGKAFGKSIRYHYEDGIFKNLDENKSRVIFLYYDENYLNILKKYFRKIIIYDSGQEKDILNSKNQTTLK